MFTSSSSPLPQNDGGREAVVRRRPPPGDYLTNPEELLALLKVKEGCIAQSIKGSTALLEMVECHSPGHPGAGRSDSLAPLISASPLHHQLSAELNLLIFLQSRYQEVIHTDLSSLSPSHQSVLLSHALTTLMRIEAERTVIYSNEMKERIPTLRQSSDSTTPAWIRSTLKGLYPSTNIDGRREGEDDSEDCVIVEFPVSRKASDTRGVAPTPPLQHPPRVNGVKRKRERDRKEEAVKGVTVKRGVDDGEWTVIGLQEDGLRYQGLAPVSLRPPLHLPVRAFPCHSSASPSSSSSSSSLAVSSLTTSPSADTSLMLLSSPLLPPLPHAGGLPSLVLPPPMAEASADVTIPRRSPSILHSPPTSSLPLPQSPVPHPLSAPPSCSSSSSSLSSPPPGPHQFLLLPKLHRDPHSRVRVETVLLFSHEIPQARGFRLQCFSLARSLHDPLVKATQRLLKEQFHNCGDTTRCVYYLLLTSPYPAVPIISASYFILKDQRQKGGAVIDLMGLMTVAEMRGLGFGSVLYEGYREVAGRVSVCREWKGLDGKCELVVHSIEGQMGWWKRMGCDYLEKGEGVKEDGVGFPNTFAMIDRGRERTDAELMHLVNSIAQFAPGLSAWGGEGEINGTGETGTVPAAAIRR